MLSNDDLMLLPCGISDFNALRAEGRIYVDKTDLIYELIRYNARPIFLSRPRRFGKSLLLSTIDSYFRYGTQYFEGLKLEAHPIEDRFQVIHLDFSMFENDENSSLSKELIDALLDQYALLDNPPQLLSRDEGSPAKILKRLLLSAKSKNVVILIDEYDAPLLARLGNKEEFERALNVYRPFFNTLKSLFSAKVRFCMLTGVSRFSQASIFSGFNTIKDISFSDEYSALVGFTRQELEHYFRPYIENVAESYSISYEECLEGLTLNYDGYCFDLRGQGTVYNPWSVLSCLESPSNNKKDNRFEDYWGKTGSLNTFTDKFFKVNSKTLDLPQILSDINRLTNPIIFDYDEATTPVEFSSISISILMMQTGYLTIRSLENDLYLTIPNEEVRKILGKNFLTYLRPLLGKPADSKALLSLRTALYSADPKLLQERFNELLSRIGPASRQDVFAHENTVRDILGIALLAAGLIVLKEVEGTVGRADLLVYSGQISAPASECAIFEFKRLAKYSETDKEQKIANLCREAQEQICSRHYDLLGGIAVKTQLYAVIINAQKYDIARVEKLREDSHEEIRNLEQSPSPVKA